MMRGRPKDLPEHISEENLGQLWQSVCAMCDLALTWDEDKLSTDGVLAKMLEFRRIHRQCDREEHQPYQREKDCTRCGRTSELFIWASPRSNPVLFYTFCDWCIADDDSLNEWLSEQLRIHFENSPDLYERLPDGRWRSRL